MDEWTHLLSKDVPLLQDIMDRYRCLKHNVDKYLTAEQSLQSDEVDQRVVSLLPQLEKRIHEDLRAISNFKPSQNQERQILGRLFH